MNRESSEHDTPHPDLHRLIAGILEDLGGRKFILDWARRNPTDFIRLLASLPTSSAEGRPETPEHVSPIIHEAATSSVETGGKHVGAFDRRGAAEYLSISTRLLDDLLSAGAIRKVKIGRKTLVRKVDLDNYLARLANEAEPTKPGV